MITGDVTPYTDLITSEHNDKPNYMAMIAAVLQPFADGIANVDEMPDLFDLDVAVGQQLDYTGQWIGQKRQIQIPIEGVFFTWDTPGLGWDGPAVWWDGSSPLSVGFTLDDPAYRILLYAKAAANAWDGSIPDAYRAWNILFQGTYTIKIFDGGDMSMGMELDGPPPTPITIAMFRNGYLDLRPSGVRVTSYKINGV